MVHSAGAGNDIRRYSSASAETLRPRYRTPSTSSTNTTVGGKSSPRTRPPSREYSMPSIASQPRSGWESSAGISRVSRGFRRPSTSPGYAPSLIETFRSSTVRGPRQSFDIHSPFGRSPSPSGPTYSDIGSLEQSEILPGGFHGAGRERPTASDTSFGGGLHAFSDDRTIDRHDARASSSEGTWEGRHREDELCASMTDETGTA